WADVPASVWQGGQVNAHVVVAGQRLDHAILGGMLGSFGVRLLAGFHPADYVRLVGVPPVQRSQKPRGRFLLYEGGETTWLQLVYADPAELRDYALETVRQRSDLGAQGGQGHRDIMLVTGLAAAAAYLGMTEDAFKKARQRRPVDGEVAAPDGRPAWSRESLTAWRESRPSAARVGEGR